MGGYLWFFRPVFAYTIGSFLYICEVYFIFYNCTKTKQYADSKQKKIK